MKIKSQYWNICMNEYEMMCYIIQSWRKYALEKRRMIDCLIIERQNVDAYGDANEHWL